MSMNDTGITRSKRGVGIALVVSALAQIALLAHHPESAAHDFQSLLQDEAGHRALNAVVHGGFVILLVVQLACYAALSQQLDFARTATIAAFVAFAAGSVFLAASVLTDGLVIPALASRYVH